MKKSITISLFEDDIHYHYTVVEAFDLKIINMVQFSYEKSIRRRFRHVSPEVNIGSGSPTVSQIQHYETLVEKW